MPQVFGLFLEAAKPCRHDDADHYAIVHSLVARRTVHASRRPIQMKFSPIASGAYQPAKITHRLPDVVRQTGFAAHSVLAVAIYRHCNHVLNPEEQDEQETNAWRRVERLGFYVLQQPGSEIVAVEPTESLAVDEHGVGSLRVAQPWPDTLHTVLIAPTVDDAERHANPVTRALLHPIVGSMTRTAWTGMRGFETLVDPQKLRW